MFGVGVAYELDTSRQQVFVLTNRNFRDDPEIGTITLTRSDKSKGTALSRTSEGVAPKAVKLFEKARNDWQSNNQDRIKASLIEAVTIDPNFAEAWYQSGRQEQASSPATGA